MKTVLITGHLGFIGKNLKTVLEKTYNVVGLDIKEGNDILLCDLPDCDAVIHLAAISGVRQSMEDPEKYWQVNVNGTRRILEYYKDKRVLVASSSSQYEPHLNPYAASKHAMEFIPHENVCFMRLHTVYSENPRENMFFYKLLNGTLEYVTEHERDFIHINDVCDAVILLMEHGYVGSLDVGTGRTIKIKDIAPELPVKNNTPNERQVTRANTRKMSFFGFQPKHSVKDFISNNIRR
jgi:nucleoside-diphosphate-sugar epimerase